jgi:putative ABC transport system permease protein
MSIRLCLWLTAAQWRSRRTATLLSMLAIALGVALGFAIHLINQAALADFSRAMKSLQGEPDAVLAARDMGGVPMSWFERLARDPAVLLASPVVEVRVRLEGAERGIEASRVLGLDSFSATALMPALTGRRDNTASTDALPLLGDGVYASAAWLQAHHRAVGDALTLTRGDQRWDTHIVGDLPALGPGDRVLAADIAWVQARLGQVNAVSEIRLGLQTDVDANAWRKQLASQLPSTLLLRGGDDEQVRVSNLSRAYRVNLNVLALVALLTGAFLVFATQLTSVAQRTPQFALLGVLGWSPRWRFAQVLIEGLAIGVPGALFGLLMGWLLAVLFTRTIGGDLGGGYFAGSSPVIAPTVAASLLFLVLGCGASVVGAWYPAWLNRRQALAQALKIGFLHRPGRISRWRLVMLVLLGLGTVAASQLPPIAGLALGGYLAIALLLALGILCAPLAIHLMFGQVARMRLSAPKQVALQNVAQAPLLAQVAASGLIVSFALTASMIIMVGSFRLAVTHWLDDVLPAPLYARMRSAPMPQTSLDALANSGLFDRIERLQQSKLTIDPARPPVDLLIRELDRLAPQKRLPFTGEVFAVPTNETAIWVSEAVSLLYGWQPGQQVMLPMLGKTVPVRIGGIWRDYARQFGAIAISAQDYVALGGRFNPSDLALWPAAGKTDGSRAVLTQLADKTGLEFSDSGQIRALSLSIFDKSFAVTYALEAAAMLIGLFGLAVTLGASVWLRARELATLAALGFTRRMLTQAVLLEGALITLIGLSLGLVCGVAVGWVLTGVVNPQAFHWTMPLGVPWVPVLAGAVLTMLAGLLASRFAARQATAVPAARILGAIQ